MKVIVKNAVPEIQGLPEGNIVMFFAEINPDLGYCVVFGPEEKCLPKDDFHTELWSAKVAFGKQDEEMRLADVKHGHKYPERMGGGGMVTMQRAGGMTCDEDIIFFRRPENPKPSTIEAVFDGQWFFGEFKQIFIVI